MLDAVVPPVLTVDPGDPVTMACLSGGLPATPQDVSALPIPVALAAICAAGLAWANIPILTGRVAVRSAGPDDRPEVRIEAVEPAAGWGYSGAQGPELALRPLFGIMGVAPSRRYGRLSSREPRRFGGNLDNKELVARSTQFLPVPVPDANPFAGDRRGLQEGRGEARVNALEMCLNDRPTLLLRKGSPTRRCCA